MIDLDENRRLAEANHDAFEVMRYSLEGNDEITDEEIDTLVDEIAKPIIESIDCTQCGNCCRALEVSLVPEDAERLAAGLHIPVEDVITCYVDRERGAEIDEWGTFRHRPCAFLRERLCSVYPHRPEACRVYPMFTPDFRWTLAHTIDGAAMCPIICRVLIAVAHKVDELKL